jgi:hypothetical protein
MTSPQPTLGRAFLLVITMLAWCKALPATAAEPLRPPNGTYVYSMSVAGKFIFKSTIEVEGSGSTFSVSEKTTLPGGAIATTNSTWSRDTLLPLTFDVRQGRVALRAQIDRKALRLTDTRVSFARIPGTSYVLPSVGLITTTLMYPYLISAHPGKAFTVAEIHNNQSVIVRPDGTSSVEPGPAGDVAVAVMKNEEYGDSPDKERIVMWLNGKSGIMDVADATPDVARILLLSFTPE